MVVGTEVWGSSGLRADPRSWCRCKDMGSESREISAPCCYIGSKAPAAVAKWGGQMHQCLALGAVLGRGWLVDLHLWHEA